MTNQDFETADKIVQEIFQPLTLKRPPKILMDHYEFELMNKIQVGSPRRGLQGWAAGAVILLLILGLIMILARQLKE